MLFTAFVVLFSVSSCTDQDDVEITFNEEVFVTAKHLFSSYTPYSSEDFNPKSIGAMLNIEVLIYQKNNDNLMKEFHFESDNLNDEFHCVPTLPSGEYRIVAIAHFSLSRENEPFYYWNISNKSKLSDLKIDAEYRNGEFIFTSPFETLGLYTNDIYIENKPDELSINILPVTSLIQVWMTNSSYTGIAYDNIYSTKCLNAVYNTITTSTIKDKVTFKNGKPEYETSEQIKNYTITSNCPIDDLLDRNNPNTRCYRALLPETDKIFEWTIEKRVSSDPTIDDLVKRLVGPYPDKGVSSSLDLISGRQYILSMVLDAPKLWFEELKSESFDFTSLINRYMLSFNLTRIKRTIDYSWENAIGLSLGEVQQYFNSTPYQKYYSSNIERYIACFSPAPSDQYYFEPTAAFLDQNYTQCVGICLNFNIGTRAITDSEIEYIIKLLNERFTYNKQVGDAIGYFVGSREDATKIVVFDFTKRDNVTLNYRDRQYNW